MAAPDPIRAEPMSDKCSPPKTAEAEPVRSARNRRIPVCFKDYELKHCRFYIYIVDCTVQLRKNAAKTID